ncbi:hypothetical protein [Actinocrinis sp.]|uniref:hypothetical protein n=1 Tax=Actinocrinis sp. TaxID=1920516 RepID=UPI002D7566B0|nr:hypothetical protein [Actinocrinis sp.]HZP55027.1 hypothetical protein [Actinocrinis sp.]
MTNLPVPVPRTFTVGEVETGAYLNSLRDALNFLINVPIVTAGQASVQSIPNTTWTSLTLDTTVVDSYGGHSNTTNNSRYTAQVAGWYLCCGTCGFAANATGFRQIRLAKNGAQVTFSVATLPVVAATVATVIVTPTLQVFLAVGDYLEVQGFQSSGGALNTTGADPSLTATWVHA